MNIPLMVLLYGGVAVGLLLVACIFFVPRLKRVERLIYGIIGIGFVAYCLFGVLTMSSQNATFFFPLFLYIIPVVLILNSIRVSYFAKVNEVNPELALKTYTQKAVKDGQPITTAETAVVEEKEPVVPVVVPTATKGVTYNPNLHKPTSSIPVQKIDSKPVDVETSNQENTSIFGSSGLF